MQTRSSQSMWRVTLQTLLLCCFLPAALVANVQPEQAPDGLSDQEWSNIQQQVMMNKYKAFAQEDGSYASANIANGWHIDYGSDGSTTLTPYKLEDSEYFIGLKLKSLGYSNQSVYNKPQQITSDETRLTYQWDENVKEIWTNSSNRLEQWFEIQQRPQGVRQDQQLTLQMVLTTDLQITQNGNALSFADRISYNKLKVWDSTGAEIPASMHLQGNMLALVVDDSLAVYPLTIDPSFQQEAYLKASNTDVVDNFGTAVAISGDTLAVGADQEDSDATGVDGDQSNTSLGRNSGAVYIFTRTAGVWSQQAYLKASNTGSSDFFGWAVAISGDTVVVGARGEDSNATGVDGDQTNNSFLGSGAAYVFTRISGVWSQQAYLKASNTGFNDQFGWAVDISGDTVLVGAVDEDSNATSIDGDGTNNSANDAGAAYVFTRSDGTWSQQAYLKASNAESADDFGYSVAISADTVVIGARIEDSNATGIDGNQADNSASLAGAAYVFIRTSGVWNQQAYLKASNTEAGDWFGYSVDISGDTLVVATHKEDSSATGVNGDQTDNTASDSGAAYVFTRTAGIWSQQAYLKASNTEADDFFGLYAAISGDTLVIGAFGERSNATGIDGDQTNNSLTWAGAAYVFSRTADTWSQQEYLKASNTGEFDRFGFAVAISGDTVVVGAYDEESNSTGVDGDQANNLADRSGAAYVFGPTAVGLLDQAIISFTATPSTGVIAGSSTLSATANSGLPVTFGSITPAICTVTGSTVYYLVAGTCTVTADQAGDASYNPAPQITLDITVFKLDQSITGLAADPATGSVAGSSTLSATASSGLSVIFGSSTPTICTVSGSTVTYLAVGTCTVTADQAGNATYNPAPQVTLDIGVGLTDQVITNFAAAPSTGVVNGSSTLNATGGASGNPVIFGSNTLAVCTVAGSAVTYVTAGTCTVTADQAGNDSYNAAPQVTLNITVAKADQTIAGLAANPATGVAGGTSALSATASSGLAVTFGSNTLTICTVSGSTVSYLAVGTCTVTADQAGDANYNPAPQVTLDINVTATPPAVIPNVPIPTLSLWGLVAMFLMMLGIGGMIVRRRILG